MGNVFRMQELTDLQSEGNRHVGKRKLKWLESAEEDLQNMCVRNW
jgi:hypothetical protein